MATFRDYAQAHQDEFILAISNGKKGYFVDIGCYEPKKINNTLLLEENGWSGIALDIDDYSEMWKSRKTPFILADAINCNFEELFKKYNLPKVIDYLSIDIEGNGDRFKALLNVFKSGYEFKAITMEHDAFRGYADTERKPQREYLTQKGYYLLCSNVKNDGFEYEDWWVNPKYLNRYDYIHFQSESLDNNDIIKKEKIITTKRENMKFIEHFRFNFYDNMLKPNNPQSPIRNRADSLLFVFEILEANGKDAYNILETGCMRPDHGNLCFGDDGAFTFIASDFARFYPKSMIYSVDIEQKNTDYAKSMVNPVNCHIECSDSVKYLHSLPSNLKFDLIYLDSYDISRDNPHPSQLHHLKELCAIFNKNTMDGTLLVIDDHNAFLDKSCGKGDYVKMFLADIGKQPIYEDYQIIFKL